MDGEANKTDLETAAGPLDTDATIAAASTSQGETPTLDDHQKQSPDTDVGQDGHMEVDAVVETEAEADEAEADEAEAEAGAEAEAEAEAETGMIDGETDAEVDLEAAG